MDDPADLPARQADLLVAIKLVRDAWYTLQLGDQAYRAAGGCVGAVSTHPCASFGAGGQKGRWVSVAYVPASALSIPFAHTVHGVEWQ